MHTYPLRRCGLYTCLCLPGVITASAYVIIIFRFTCIYRPGMGMEMNPTNACTVYILHAPCIYNTTSLHSSAHQHQLYTTMTACGWYPAREHFGDHNAQMHPWQVHVFSTVLAYKSLMYSSMYIQCAVQ